MRKGDQLRLRREAEKGYAAYRRSVCNIDHVAGGEDSCCESGACRKWQYGCRGHLGRGRCNLVVGYHFGDRGCESTKRGGARLDTNA